MFLIDSLRSKTTERPAVLAGIFLARYKFASRFTENKKVLDIGTGLGGGAHHIACHRAKRVVGIDNSKTAINQAKKEFVLPNLEFRVVDALDILSLNERFDVIITFELIEHLPWGSYSTFIAQIKEALNPGGVCLISTPNKLISSPNRDRPYNPYHTREFTPEEFAKIIQEHFPNTKLLGVSCANKEFLEKERLVKRRLGNRLAVFLLRYKVTQKLLPIVPQKIKQLLTSENLLPPFKASDFRIYCQNIDRCEGLLAVCYSPHKRWCKITINGS